jgi:hypothetical protein
LALWALWIAGCASQLLVVPESDWQTVPAAQRARIDHQYETDLAAARAELAAATAGLKAPTLQDPGALPRPEAQAQILGTDAQGDEWKAAMRDYERATVDARTQVEAARTTWQRADLTWRQRRYDAAVTRIDVLINQRELIRAQTIDHALLGTDQYESAPLRGQFSRAQQRWYTASVAARQARAAVERASADLASRKEVYAQLMRNGPMRAFVESSVAWDRAEPVLQLSGWIVTRSDYTRRGVRRLLDEAANNPPRLRKVALVPTARAVVLPPVAAAPTGSPSGVARPSAPPATSSTSPAAAPTTARAKPTAPPGGQRAAAPEAAKPPGSASTSNPAASIAKPVAATAKPVEPSTP